MTDQSFERLARAYGDMVFRVACHALGNRADAEDVTQNVLLRLYRAGPDFESDDHARRWLLRVAVNESRRAARSPWRGKTLSLEDYDGPQPPPEDYSDVWSAVLALPAKYRLCVYLYYYEDCSVRDIAQTLGAKESTVQSRLQRAREKLRDILNGEKEGPSHAQLHILS